MCPFREKKTLLVTLLTTNFLMIVYNVQLAAYFIFVKLIDELITHMKYGAHKTKHHRSP